MSDFRKNITTHFKSKVSGELNKISVPEWQMDIYYKSAYSFATESKIIELQQAGKVVEALVESMIQKCLNPDGKPIFTNADRQMLLREADPEVILRVAGELNNATSEYKYEDVEKN